MTEKLQQTIKEEIAQLPKEIQEAIRAFSVKGEPNSGWEAVAEEIGKKNNLTEEEINDFQLETLLVLIGAVYPEFYAFNIENHVETTKEKAESMAKESFQKIFAPLKKMIEENIKKNLKDKNPNAEQTLSFILSGGNYSAFLEKQKDQMPETPAIPIKPSTVRSIRDDLVM